MRQISKNIAQWMCIDSERGVTAIEYGLIASLLAVVIVTAVTLIGTNLDLVFTDVAGKIKAP